MSLMVKMTEIDSEVISNIRKLKKKSRAYKILEHAIKQDGQLNPILIRQLTDTEKQTAKEGAMYGIIDGHHRYQIALENNQESILAEIDENPQSDYRDMELALRLNVSNISMSTIEKGEVIYNIIKVQNKDSFNEIDVAEIGQKLFGIKTSMTYRCLNAYKKANNIPTIERPRDVQLPSLNEIFERIDLVSYAIQNMCATRTLMESIQGPSIYDIRSELGMINEIKSHLKFCEEAFRKYEERLQTTEQVNDSVVTQTDENFDTSE